MKLALEDKSQELFCSHPREQEDRFWSSRPPKVPLYLCPWQAAGEAAETLHPSLVSQEGNFLHPLPRRQALSGEVCSLRRRGCFWAELGFCRV